MELEEALAYLDRTYFGDRAWEREEIEQLPRLLEGCGLFLDVGASLGQYTYYANRAMQDGRIVAIEADPDRYAVLAHRCAEWEQEDSNTITPVHAAVGDSHESVPFYITGSQISGGFFPVPERSDDYRPITVAQVTLDDFYEAGVETLVKIDVEGGEHRVFRGANAHMQGGRTRFITEIAWWGDRERGYTARDLLRFLRSRSLRIERVRQHHRSNYLLSPGRRVWPSYARVAPVLRAKAAYGKCVPARMRVARERAENRRRLARFSSRD